MRRAAALVLALATASGAAAAQKAEETPVTASPGDPGIAVPDNGRPRQPGGQTLPLAAARRLRFDAHAGTWMSLDRSPDGRRLVFDLLGDLYVMSASGGRATAIASGLAFETQPVFSPDGRSIAYVSDRSGAENLWIAKPDGSAAHQISFGDDDTVLTSPAWTPDGTALYVSRYRPSLNNYELWRYGLDGRETLVVPIRATADTPHGAWRSTLGAVVAPDGRSLYLAVHVGGLDFDDVDRWTIVRRDIATGAETTIVAEPDGPRTALNPGSVFRPALSPDGRLLAYGRRRDGRTELRLRDLATGIDRTLAFPIERDQLQASMWQDILPRYAFTPDGSAILIAVAGRIERIGVADGAVTAIPFTAPVDLAVGPSTRQDIHEDDGPVHVELAMAPTVSPDGRRLAFSALGRLYLMALDEPSAPVPLATGDAPAFQPAWSADGRRLAWVTWSERGGGAVWTAAADGSAAPQRIIDVPAFYTNPVFTPGGDAVIAIRSAQQARLDLYMEYGALREALLVALDPGGGAARIVTGGKMGGRPQMIDAHTAYLLGEEGVDRVDLTTGRRTPAVAVKGPGWYFQDGPVAVDDIRISPDGRWLLALSAQQLHLVAMPPTPRTVNLLDPHLPHRRVTAAGADYAEWSADGRTIIWSAGHTVHTVPLAEVARQTVATPDWTAAAATPDRRDYRIDLAVPRARASGALLLHGARVMTMAPK